MKQKISDSKDGLVYTCILMGHAHSFIGEWRHAFFNWKSKVSTQAYFEAVSYD